jgi:ribosome assembly protein YihI (activator of Der GTPase)
MNYPPSARPFVEENLTLKHKLELAEKENARLKKIIERLENGETIDCILFSNLYNKLRS